MPLGSEQEIKLAALARDHFHSADYPNCIQVLEELLRVRPNDPKVRHNLLVAQRLAKGSKAASIITDLAIIMRSNEKASLQAPSELLHQRAPMLYNEAVLKFGAGELKSAAVLLEPLVELFEKVADEKLVFRICFLLLDIYLELRSVEDTTRTIHALEKYVNSRAERLAAGSSKQHVPLSPSLQAAAATEDITPELSYARFMIDLYRARSMILCKVFSTSKRLMTRALTISPQNANALSLKGAIPFHRRQFDKSLRLLSLIPNQTLEQSVCASNDLGCVYLLKGNSMSASYHFDVALRAADTPGSSPINIHQRVNLIYNFGVAILQLGEVERALKMFTLVSEVHHTFPLVWLRMAECCIQLNGPQNLSKLNRSSFVATARSRDSVKLLLKPDDLLVTVPSSDNTQNDACSLRKAVLYLKNCLVLLNKDIRACELEALQEAKKPAAKKSVPSKDADEIGNEVQTTRLQDFRALLGSVHLTNAYVCLSVGNAAEALVSCDYILDDTTLSPLLKYNALLYSIQALIALGQMKEAIRRSAPQKVNEIVQDAETVFTGRPEHVKENLRSIMLLNTAAMFAVKEDLDRCAQCLDAATAHNPSVAASPQAIMLYIFQALKRGNTALATVTIRKHCIPRVESIN